MKQIKKLFSYLVALAMVFSIVTLAGVNVHAAGETTSSGTKFTLTVNNNDSKQAHTFEIYQIFKGDYNKKENEAATLSNIEWGTGVTDAGKTALGSAKAKAETLKDEAAAKSFANTLVAGDSKTSYLKDPVTQAIESGKSAEVSVSAGYYLIKDKDGSQTGKSGAYTSYILKVVGNTTANTKLDVPTVEKKVEDTNDTKGTTSDWQDSADYDFNDNVPYKLTGTLPSNYDKYTTYTYQFNDTMSAGLTFNNDIKVYKNSIDENHLIDSTNYKVDSSAHSFTLKFENLKNVASSASDQIIVTYSAKLNENAVIGSAGNPNTVDLTYSNNPNQGGEGETGKTPEDKNIVFTYKTVVNKVDKDNNPLKGAGFTLQKKVNGTYQDIKTIKAGETTKFEFSGLDDGDYKLIESTTPSGYNTIAPIEFTITATHDTDSGDPKLTELNGVKATGEIDLGTQQKATVDTSAGSITANVVNNKGSELPETGGMGTTLLYGVGAILVAAAAAYVVMNKKHSTNK